MKLKVNRAALAAAVAACCGVVNTKHPTPAFTCARLRAEGEWLRVTCSDGDLSQDRWVEAAVELDGSLCVPALKLKSAVDALAGDEVELETVPTDVLKIGVGESHLSLRGYGAEEFPAGVELEEPASATMRAADLKRALRLTEFAMSTDASRTNLCGLLLSFQSGELTVVGTDGRRLNRVLAACCELEAGFEFLVPSKAVKALLAACPDGDEEVTVSANDRTCSLNTGTALVTSKLIDGKFPEWGHIVTELAHEVELPRERMLAMVKAADVVTSEKFCCVKVEAFSGRLVVGSESPEHGTAKSMEEVAYSGPHVKVGFGPRYLLEPLASSADEQVRFKFTDELSPGHLCFGTDFVCVIMPMRFS